MWQRDSTAFKCWANFVPQALDLLLRASPINNWRRDPLKWYHIQKNDIHLGERLYTVLILLVIHEDGVISAQPHITSQVQVLHKLRNPTPCNKPSVSTERAPRTWYTRIEDVYQRRDSLSTWCSTAQSLLVIILIILTTLMLSFPLEFLQASEL